MHRCNGSCAAEDVRQLPDDELEHLVAVLRSWQTPYGSFSYREVFLGALSTFTLGIVLGWLQRAYVVELFGRYQRTRIVRAVRDMEPEALNKMLGEVDLPSWVNFPDFERVRWVNAVLDGAWPHLSKALAAQGRAQLVPMLDANKPAWMAAVSLVRFDLGEKAPQINGIKVYQGDRIEDEVNIEVDVMWAGKQDVQLALQLLPLPGRLGVLSRVGDAVGATQPLRVGLASLIFSGRLRIALKPLMNKLPIVAAMQMALVDMPDFSFDLNVLGGDVSAVPGLENWLKSTVYTNVIRPYVLPGKYVLPLVAPEDMGIQPPKGMLFVTLVAATDVPKMDLFGESDCYVKLSVRQKVELKSQIQENSRDPEWNEDFRLLVYKPDQEVLSLELFDHDVFDPDDRIGAACLPVRDLDDDQEHDLWLDVDLAPVQDSQKEGLLRILVQAKDVLRDLARRLARRLPGVREPSDRPCRVHIKAHYVEFAKEEVEAASGGELAGGNVAREPPGGSPTDHAKAQALDALQGGVLYVLVKRAMSLPRKPFLRGRFGKRKTALRVNVAGQEKRSVTAKGEDPVFAKPLVFLLGGEEVRRTEREDGSIEIQVWDERLGRTELGAATLRLRDVLEQRRFKDRLRIGDAGELDVEAHWLALMGQHNMPT
ncbi:hypothetical protein WJX81_005293 [Elliptochloris bilobata]|uniref:Plant synaptotagmin n=1 Tax=Elliptochloris bilobata TaxID=381761 RepID=A0AAW1RRB0_9CHLO